MNSKCALCKEDSNLKISHYIPSFIGKWFKKTSITGYIRTNANVSLRKQDLFKEYLLCANCEGMFSKWETQFAERVFYPYINDRKIVINYESWLSKFCASLSWRTLIYIIRNNDLSKYDAEYNESLNKAKNTLEEFILDKSKILYCCEQHLYPLDEISSTTLGNLPTNINRYLIRSMGMDVINNKDSILIYTKIPYFILIGLVKSNETSIMKSSRIKLKKGTLSPRRYNMPKGIDKYIIEQAKKVSELDAQIPIHQQKEIEMFLYDNPERAAKSNTIEAFEADLRMFGNKAFKK